jgi:hypothetical protein
LAFPFLQTGVAGELADRYLINSQREDSATKILRASVRHTDAPQAGTHKRSEKAQSMTPVQTLRRTSPAEEA